MNKEVKRRADVVGIFPNEDRIVRLTGEVELLSLEQIDALCERINSEGGEV